jgi:outer membrane murein-binding lipoprotein Lpp
MSVDLSPLVFWSLYGVLFTTASLAVTNGLVARKRATRHASKVEDLEAEVKRLKAEMKKQQAEVPACKRELGRLREDLAGLLEKAGDPKLIAEALHATRIERIEGIQAALERSVLGLQRDVKKLKSDAAERKATEAAGLKAIESLNFGRWYRSGSGGGSASSSIGR